MSREGELVLGNANDIEGIVKAKQQLDRYAN